MQGLSHPEGKHFARNGHLLIAQAFQVHLDAALGSVPDRAVDKGVEVEVAAQLAIDPFKANTFYIGTDIGVFQTTDGGTTWTRLGNGMPKVATFMVRYHEATRSLIAATHGRGIFRLPAAHHPR